MAKSNGGDALVALGTAAVVVLITKAVVEEQAKQERAKRRLVQEQAERAWRRATFGPMAQDYVVNAMGRVANLLRMPVPPLFFHGCDNAAAWTREKICFNLDWAVDQLAKGCESRECVYVRILAVVAHEFGHYTDPQIHLRTAHSAEYYADDFMGQVLGCLDVSPDHILDIVRTWPGATSHPVGWKRMQVIRQGYQKATGYNLVAT